MAKEYLTIRRFAQLRGVNINSLRYYEKLKILVPAWIDPQTKYRYYLPEQLITLDTILLCIQLGIPLKTLRDYMDENGNLKEKVILEKGKERLLSQISELQQGIELTEFQINSIEENQKYSGQKGIYRRRIKERYLMETPFNGDFGALHEKEEAAMKLFNDAQAQSMVPVFPAGIVIHCETAPVSYSFFVQVLHPDRPDSRIIHIPEAEFLCRQLDITPEMDLLETLRRDFDTDQLELAIIANMPLAKTSFNSWHSEVQVPV